jgi:uncharacterized protein (TIGR00251 family)
MTSPVRDTPDGALLSIRVVPRARRSEIAGLRGDSLLVRLAAPPVDGAANAALLEFVAERLRLARHRVTLVSGERSRVKLLRVAGLTGAEVQARMSAP